MNLIYLTPVISSFIGYFTNYIAIIMLFRPYDDVKIGKLKIFGKGVIPSNHHKLADSIGKTVSKELLSHDDVIKELRSGDIQQFVEKFVHDQMDDFFTKDLPSLNNLLPVGLNEIWLTISQKIEIAIEQKLEAFFSDSENNKTLSVFLEKWIDSITKETLFSEEQNTDLKESFKKQINSYVEKSLNQENILELIKNLIEKTENDNRQLKEIIPESLNSSLKEQFPKISNTISAELITFFNENDEEIKSKIQEKLMEYIEKMNLGMIAAFLPEGFIQQKLEFIPKKILAFAQEYLESEDGQTRIISTIGKIYQTFLNKELNTILAEIELTQNKEFVNGLASFISENLKEQSFKQMINENISEFIDLNFDKIIDTAIDYIKINSSQISKRIINNISTFIMNNPEFWKKIYHNEFRKIISQPIGKLSRIISPKVQNKIKSYTWNKISDFIIKYSPDLVKSINIKHMVSSKVKSFPLPKMEKIIRDVAHKELKYVTFFGGILGFLIGVIQIFIYLIN